MRGLRNAIVASGIAIALMLGGMSAAEAAPRSAKASFSVSVTYNADLQDLNGKGHFHGVLTGLPSSTPVQVQRRTADGSWRTLATARSGAHGAYSGTFAASGLGRTSFRAHVAATKRRAAVASVTKVVTVSEFFKLDTIPIAKPAAGASFGPLTTDNGTVVPHTIVMDGAQGKDGNVTVTWTLGGHCSKVLSLVEIPGSEDALRAHATVGNGTRLIATSVVTSDGIVFLQTPVDGLKTLSLTTSIDDKGKGAQKVNWLFPSVLCSVDPRSL
jgi:hypothetical protein